MLLVLNTIINLIVDMAKKSAAIYTTLEVDGMWISWTVVELD